MNHLDKEVYHAINMMNIYRLSYKKTVFDKFKLLLEELEVNQSYFTTKVSFVISPLRN